MRQLDLISHSRVDKKKSQRLRGFVWSALFHALLVALVVALGFLYHWQLPLIDKGSVEGAQVVSLEIMEIVAPPVPPTPPSPHVPVMALNSARHPLAPEHDVVARPIIGIPILPEIPTMTLQAISAKTGALIHLVTIVASSGGGIAHLRPTTDKFVSSLEGYLSVLPHPPYPATARELQQTGIVRMLVQFDKMGNVARAVIAQSSGVAVLDSETRAFIRNNWHSAAYAGQSISVPVEYKLTSL